MCQALCGDCSGRSGRALCKSLTVTTIPSLNLKPRPPNPPRFRYLLLSWYQLQLAISMDNQSGSTSTQPATVGKPAPGTGAGFSIPIPRDAAGRPIDSTLTEPTEVDEQTKQGSVTLFITVTRPTRLFTASDPRNLHTPTDPYTGFSHTSYVGSTQPGDGAAARVVVDAPSWKEKVIGYAKKTRGTMLRRVWVQVWRSHSPPF